MVICVYVHVPAKNTWDLKEYKVSVTQDECILEAYVQHSDYGQYCSVYSKFPKTVDIKRSYCKIPFLTGPHAVICRKKLVLKSRHSQLFETSKIAVVVDISWCLNITEI